MLDCKIKYTQLKSLIWENMQSYKCKTKTRVEVYFMIKEYLVYKTGKAELEASYCQVFNWENRMVIYSWLEIIYIGLIYFNCLWASRIMSLSKNKIKFG
jgi:hypothetical protein